jgi:crossover junction endodeoxyribonuclease RuvC
LSITAAQFEQLKRRVSGAKRVPTAAVPEVNAATRPMHEVVLGVDPSLRGTGYGIIRQCKPAPALVAHGTIKCPPGWDRSRCLAKVAQELRDIIKSHKPTVCIIEALFYAQNLQTAILMGEARGASLVAAAEAGLDIFEIAPRKVKQAIVGYGAAQKLAVAKMVQRMLNIATLPEPDAADALALALTHVQEQSRYSLVAPRRV